MWCSNMKQKIYKDRFVSLIAVNNMLKQSWYFNDLPLPFLYIIIFIPSPIAWIMKRVTLKDLI